MTPPLKHLLALSTFYLPLVMSNALPRAVAEPPLQIDPSAVIDAPQFDRQKGVWRFTVTSRFQRGPNAIEVLLPERIEPGHRYRVLYVLPVETGIGGRYGDGLLEVKKIDAHNRHDLICVAPAFDTVPWFMDHASDPKVQQESYLLKVVVPLIDQHYPTRAARDGRLLLGFSKSGWGAFTLLLRNPEVFGYAAAWDSPLMLQKEHWRNWGIDQAAGTVDNFRNYQPSRLLKSQAEHFQGPSRFALLGHKNFGSGGGPIYGGSHQHTRWTHEVMLTAGIRHAYDNEIQVDHAWNTGWVARAVEALVALSAAD